MFGYRARIGYISPSVIELNTYDFYRIVPKGVGMIGVVCMVGGSKEEAYRQALAQVEACARELGRRLGTCGLLAVWRGIQVIQFSLSGSVSHQLHH